VSGALAFAHQRSIVHRDIKPGNILLADGQAILADFGIARAVSSTATPLTESGVTPGTPPYMAPELWTDERADVYALGIVAHEMLTGDLPRSHRLNVKTLLAQRGTVSGDQRAPLRGLCRLIVSAPVCHARTEAIKRQGDLGSPGRCQWFAQNHVSNRGGGSLGCRVRGYSCATAHHGACAAQTGAFRNRIDRHGGGTNPPPEPSATHFLNGVELMCSLRRKIQRHRLPPAPGLR
jgi:serine/threonine protein kinase